MAEDWREVAKKVRNWGRWGKDDELGTLNFITPDKVKQAASLVKKGKIFPLGVDFNSGGPQGGHGTRRNPIHVMTVDGGDANGALAMLGVPSPHAQELGHIFQAGPMRYNDDWIMMPLQAATQWDALSHVYYDGQMYNGFPASAVTSTGASKLSIDKMDKKGVATRAILLDVARHRKLDHVPPSTPIQPAELDEVAASEKVTIEAGDVVLVRTGWWPVFLAKRDGLAWAMGSPGLSWKCAEWLWKKQAAAVACDNVAVECIPGDLPEVTLAFHLLCIRDMGMMLGEMWNFEQLATDCAEDKQYAVHLVAQPIKFTGAVGSPLNPIALK